MNYEGVWTALWTPVDANGELVQKALQEHIEFLRKAGVQGLLIGGSTGEFTRLKPKVRLELISCVKKYAGSLPLLVNISDTLFDNVKELAQESKRVGVNGILILPPSYYAVSQEDIAAYFTAVASFTEGLDFFLYNFPECVRNCIELETIHALVDRIPLCGIKHSGSNFSYLQDLAKIKSKKPFAVFTGVETRYSEALAFGAKGSIGGLSNGIPELVLDLYTKSKNKADIKESQQKMEKIGKTISSLQFPFNVAALMKARGLETGSLKIPCSQKSLALQATAIQELKTFF